MIRSEEGVLVAHEHEDDEADAGDQEPDESGSRGVEVDVPEADHAQHHQCSDEEAEGLALWATAALMHHHLPEHVEGPDEPEGLHCPREEEDQCSAVVEVGDLAEVPVHHDSEGGHEDARDDEAEALAGLVDEQEGGEQEDGHCIEDPGVGAPGVVDGGVEADAPQDDDGCPDDGHLLAGGGADRDRVELVGGVLEVQHRHDDQHDIGDQQVQQALRQIGRVHVLLVQCLDDLVRSPEQRVAHR